MRSDWFFPQISLIALMVCSVYLDGSKYTQPMSRRTIAIAAVLSMLALGSPLIIANANPLANQHFDQGVEKHLAGNHQGAIDDSTKAIEINPQYADAYRLRGSSKFTLGDNQGAIADFNKAIEINPQDAITYRIRGLAKRWSRDYQGAIADYTKAIELDPQDAYAYEVRGSARESVYDHDGACRDWRKAVDLGLEEPAEWVKIHC